MQLTRAVLKGAVSRHRPPVAGSRRRPPRSPSGALRRQEFISGLKQHTSQGASKRQDLASTTGSTARKIDSVMGNLLRQGGVAGRGTDGTKQSTGSSLHDLVSALPRRAKGHSAEVVLGKQAQPASNIDKLFHSGKLKIPVMSVSASKQASSSSQGAKQGEIRRTADQRAVGGNAAVGRLLGDAGARLQEESDKASTSTFPGATNRLQDKLERERRKKLQRKGIETSVANRSTGSGEATRLHPCVVQRGMCTHTADGCPFRYIPAELCLTYLSMGSCNDAGCQWVHEDATQYAERRLGGRGPGESGAASSAVDVANVDACACVLLSRLLQLLVVSSERMMTSTTDGRARAVVDEVVVSFAELTTEAPGSDSSEKTSPRQIFDLETVLTAVSDFSPLLKLSDGTDGVRFGVALLSKSDSEIPHMDRQRAALIHRQLAALRNAPVNGSGTTTPSQRGAGEFLRWLSWEVLQSGASSGLHHATQSWTAVEMAQFCRLVVRRCSPTAAAAAAGPDSQLPSGDGDYLIRRHEASTRGQRAALPPLAWMNLLAKSSGVTGYRVGGSMRGCQLLSDRAIDHCAEHLAVLMLEDGQDIDAFQAALVLGNRVASVRASKELFGSALAAKRYELAHRLLPSTMKVCLVHGKASQAETLGKRHLLERHTEVVSLDDISPMIGVYAMTNRTALAKTLWADATAPLKTSNRLFPKALVTEDSAIAALRYFGTSEANVFMVVDTINRLWGHVSPGILIEAMAALRQLECDAAADHLESECSSKYGVDPRRLRNLLDGSELSKHGLWRAVMDALRDVDNVDEFIAVVTKSYPRVAELHTLHPSTLNNAQSRSRTTTPCWVDAYPWVEVKNAARRVAFDRWLQRHQEGGSANSDARNALKHWIQFTKLHPFFTTVFHATMGGGA